jgi:simple sugar transport system permease protein
MRAVGENEAAAESVGIKVNKIKFLALSISGLMAALGGMVLSMGYLSFFNAGMTAGRGFLSIATNAMSGSNPILGLFASMIYGFFDAISSNIAMVSQRFDMIFRLLPYTLIIIVYAIFSYVRKKKNKENFEF